MPSSGAFRRSLPTCQAMASTKGGMRRILKQPISTIEYIKKAVESGIYRTDAEMQALHKERRDESSGDDLRLVMMRFRQDIVRGSYIHDYPTEYLILEQHPPIPDPPRTPVKYLKQLQPPPNPVEKLTKQYLDRQDRDNNANKNDSSNSSTLTPEEYYRRLLGVQAAEEAQAASLTNYTAQAFHMKPARIQKAYAAAVQHYELVRTEGMSDSEAIQRVDELLATVATQEQTVSRQRTTQVQKWRQERNNNDPSKKGQNNNSLPFRVGSSSSSSTGKEVLQLSDNKDSTTQDDDDKDEDTLERTLASIFGASPRAAEAMMRWSERLHAVPYPQWTIGASTALDHWIARQLLGFSEETWQCLLEGSSIDDDTEEDDHTLLSKGRDIVAVREALFPETILEPPSADEPKEGEEDSEEALRLAQEKKKEEEEPENKSIDDLLKSLGGLTSPTAAEETTPAATDAGDDDDSWSYLGGVDEDYTEEGGLDGKVDRLVHELQGWRRRNMEEPYANWIEVEKEKFDRWMKDYVKTVASDAERMRGVDYDETREALLSLPPVEEHESQEFWESLQDDGQAAALLDKMIKDGPPPGASILHKSFWDLPREEQLERLLNLGALRPLLDEYTKESDRLRFLQRYGDTILAGVELDHLVIDPEGPVQTSDISEDVIQALKIAEGSRFRLEKIPFRGSADTSAMEKSRLLFKAWNEHKAGRARYEERLFQTQRLGLRYGDEPEER